MAAGSSKASTPLEPHPVMALLARHNGGEDSASTLAASTTSVSHVLSIQGYSMMSKVLPNGKGVASCRFRVGGSDTCSTSWWRIQIFPNGNGPESAGFVSLYAALDRADDTTAKAAIVGFDVLDMANGEPVPRYARTGNINYFTHSGAYCGYGDFIRRDELEKGFLRDDGSFSVRCTVTVVDFLAASTVPPPDWPLHFRDLLQSGQGADVRFLVDGETFAAHRCVLAARSPVFKAELYGVMAESAAEHCIRIEGMTAEVFKNLLHFVYTDSLPRSKEEDAQEDDVVVAMAQHLMVAADRYGMERLKLVCVDTLCRKIGVSTAATTLALAGQHGCQRLKEACFEYLLKSPTTLHEVMATKDLDHLSKSCPCLLKELTSKHVACYSELDKRAQKRKANKATVSSPKRRNKKISQDDVLYIHVG